MLGSVNDVLEGGKSVIHPSNTMNTPQCHSIEQREGTKPSLTNMGQSKLSDCEISDLFIVTDSNEDAYLYALPDDTLFQILLYCGPCDVEENVKVVCRRLQ